MRAPAFLRRSGPGVIARWSAALVVLALLMPVLVLARFQLYAVRTGSMEPLFGPRDLVVVLRGEYRQGQPISFAHDGAVITHRFVSVNPDGTFVTAGDANTTADPWVVKRRDVIGGVVASAPQLATGSSTSSRSRVSARLSPQWSGSACCGPLLASSTTGPSGT